MMAEIEELVTVPEAARFYRRREETIRRWIVKGLLPAGQLPNGEYRIRKSDLVALLHDPDRVTKRRAAKAAQIKATEGLSVEQLESATLVPLPTVEALAEMIVAGLETAMKPPLFRLAPKPLAQHLHDALAAEQATGS